MKIHSTSFEHGSPIPPAFAFCRIGTDGPVDMSENRNPHLAWEGVPDGTKSLALVCHDPDVPSVGDDVNQVGKRVPADLPRVDFFHWVLVDLPAGLRSIEAGHHADGVTPKGKALDAAPEGIHGINDYTGWFAGDPDMAGNYGGYDGPCPPWNDTIVHHYHFTLYALDVETLGLTGAFTGAQARAAMEGHVLAEAAVMGTYSLNPEVPA